MDGVNVGSDVFIIETDITKKGSVVWKGQYVDHRDKLSRKKRWMQSDEDVVYSAKQLDDTVVSTNQIRLIVKTLKEHFPEIFLERLDIDGKFEVPKTLVFCKVRFACR